MSVKSYQDSAMEVMESLARGKPTVSLGRALPDAPRPYALIVGGTEVITTTDPARGYVIPLGLTRDQVRAIRESCEAILKEPEA